MIIAGVYSFNGGREYVESRFASELNEVRAIIANIDSISHKTKTSTEKTMRGKQLYSPRALNQAFKQQFEPRGWRNYRVKCEYPNEFYIDGYQSTTSSSGAFRDMDFVKGKLGVEIQFGKYAFMVYNVCAKMTIFHNQGVIDAGIEIVPVKDFVTEMSSGVSYFEQFVWDLGHRGVSNIDIPVLILGIAA
jgi:hypothetical protein